MRISTSLSLFALFLTALMAWVGWTHVEVLGSVRAEFGQLRDTAHLSDSARWLDRRMTQVLINARAYLVSGQTEFPASLGLSQAALREQLLDTAKVLPAYENQLRAAQATLLEYEASLEQVVELRRERQAALTQLLRGGRALQAPLNTAMQYAFEHSDFEGSARAQRVALRLHDAVNGSLSGLLRNDAGLTAGFAKIASATAQANVAKAFNAVRDDLTRLELTLQHEPARTAAQQTRNMIAPYLLVWQRVSNGHANTDAYIAATLVPQADALQAQLAVLSAGVAQANLSIVSRFDAMLTRASQRNTTLLLSGAAFAVLGAGVLIAFIILPLTRLAKLMTRLAAQDRLAGTVPGLAVSPELANIPYARQRNEVGAIARALGVFRDALVAQRKARGEAEAVAASERELGELKTRFISMASHEFRTPLSTILTSTELVEHYDARLSAEEKKEAYTDIRAAVVRMKDILEDVLVLGRIDSGKQTVQRAPVQLVALCQKLIAETRSIDNQRHPIEFEVLRDDPRTESSTDASTAVPQTPVMLDENLLRHILGNLLGNACKYSGVGLVVRFTLHQQATRVRFTVADSGIGIPDADLPHLFESFHRAQNVGTVSGTGLGLSIVKRSAELHGGKVTVSSVVGQGTRFEVELPLVDS